MKKVVPLIEKLVAPTKLRPDMMPAVFSMTHGLVISTSRLMLLEMLALIEAETGGKCPLSTMCTSPSYKSKMNLDIGISCIPSTLRPQLLFGGIRRTLLRCGHGATSKGLSCHSEVTALPRVENSPAAKYPRILFPMSESI
jgi:hypothetical protein